MIKYIAITSILIAFISQPARAAELDGTTTQWSPYLEWSFTNPTNSGNPYDLLATATFTHAASNETRTTEMFYAGNNTWKVRFTATQTGQWTATTQSSDADLDGMTGTITVNPNPSDNAKGFIVSSGNRYARQSGENGTLEGMLFNVYLDETDFLFLGGFNDSEFSDFQVQAHIDAYLQKARDNGFDTVHTHVNNNFFQLDATSYFEHQSVNPDLQTFQILDNLINSANQQNMIVHIWPWGDESRGWTPVGVGNGINGTPDRRLQRYIAARLGPLPNWTMSYGFDLQEWVSENQLRDWASYIHQRSGWPHLLMARGRQNSELDVISYSGLEDFQYDDAVDKLNSDQNRPHLYEERFQYLREEVYDMNGTRTKLWQYAMAGGIGSFWGRLFNGQNYPRPEQLRTHNQFWQGRFLLNMVRANNLTDGNGYVLRTPSNSQFVFYKENTNSVRLNLNNAPSSLSAIAIDTRKAYSEIDLGNLTATNQVWNAPNSSDWAIAVGNFDNAGGGNNDVLAPAAPSGLTVTTQ